MPLKAAQLKHIQPRDKAYKLADAGGLYLLIKPDGSRYWRLKYRFGGVEKSLALGVYPEVSLTDARDARDEAKRQLRAGVDPGAARKEARRAAKQAREHSFEAVAREWMSRMAAAKWSPQTYEEVRRSLERDLFPHIGARPVAEITGPELLEVLRRAERRGVYETLRKLRRRADAVFAFAIAAGLCDQNPAAGVKGALTPPASPKDRGYKGFAALPAEELPAFLRKLDAYFGEAETRLGLTLLVLTAVRTGELRFATWEEFQLEGDEPIWSIPAQRTKMGREHLVPLSEQAVVALRTLRDLTGHRDLVLASRRARGKPVSENTLNFAIRRLGFSGTGHGFRKVFSTWAHESGWLSDAIERQLGHAPTGVRGIYNRAEHLALRRTLLQAWANHLDALRGGATVIPLRGTGT